MSVIRHEGYFTSLPGGHYTSPDRFRTEIEYVFERQWLYVGHVSQVREPGQYYVARAATESLIVTRDRDGQIRTFFNVCRHRGSQVCAEHSAGSTNTFVCPYHRWSWGTDGGLVGAPGSADIPGFDPAAWPLHEARCDVLGGLIYVWLGAEAGPSLAEFVGPIDESKLAAIEPERAKVAAERRYIVQANWKLMLENNCECHHCAWTHPTLTVACDYQRFFLDRDADGSLVHRGDGSFPVRDGMKTFSADGDWVCGVLLGTPQQPGFSTGWITVPMFAAIAWFADHGVSVIVNPVTVDTSELWCQWLVHEDAVEGRDYDVDALIKAFHVTNEEDVALVEGNARGTRSRRYVPGPNSPTREDFIDVALTRYLELMGEA